MRRERLEEYRQDGQPVEQAERDPSGEEGKTGQGKGGDGRESGYDGEGGGVELGGGGR